MERWIEEGVSVAEVARRLGRSRQTIYNRRKRLKDAADGRKAEPDAPGTSKLDPYKSHIESRLDKFDLPSTVLIEEIRKQGYTGGLTILRDFVAGVKNRHVRRLVDRFETEPGRQAQLDWASCGTIVHEGRRRRLSLLMVVLGHSRVIWAKFVVSERRPVLFELLEEAFRDLGGVPRELLIDNMKQAVEVARTPDTAAQLQSEFSSFQDHWNFETVACPPYWPRAKGKVERAISYVKGSFLEGRSFEGLADLNAQLRHWLATTANVRIHGTTGVRPIDRFEADVEAMLPVQERAFPSSEQATRQVDHDGRISFRGVRYSVDPEIVVGRRFSVEVTVSVSTDQRLRIHLGERVVGEHALKPSGSEPQDNPMHAEARRRRRDKPDYRRPRGKGPHFEQIGEGAETDQETRLPEAPVVQERSLDDFEEAA